MPRPRRNPSNTVSELVEAAQAAAAHPVLRHSVQSVMDVAGDMVSFTRGGSGAGAIFCAFNLGGEAANVTLPEGRWVGIGEAVGSVAATGGTVQLPAWGICIARKA